MAIQFASAPGNLFNRMGKLGLLAKQLRSYHVAQNTNMTDPVAGVTAQFVGEPDIQALMGSSYLGALAGSNGGISGIIAGLAAAAVDRVVFRDNPQPGQTLQKQAVLASIQEVIRQMKMQGGSVLAMTVAATPQATMPTGGNFSGIGNGVLVTSVRRPLDGLVLENAFAETLNMSVTADSYSGGQAVGNETITVNGEGLQSDTFAFNWPLGSGLTGGTLNAINGAANNTNGNLLTNSSSEAYTAITNVPDNWQLTAGTPGTNVAQSQGITYGGLSSTQILGDGTTNTQLTQQFNSQVLSGPGAGTPGVLTPLTQYAVNLFLRRDSVAAGAGVLTVDLVDGNGTVIQDANGIANSFAIDLTKLTVNFAAASGVFRTPANLPAVQVVRLTLTTPLTNGRSVYLDNMSFGPMTQLYPSGPFVSVHSGSIPFVLGDYSNVVVTNSRGAGGVLDTFQTLWARSLPQMIANELILPSSSTPTISDSLIG